MKKLFFILFGFLLYLSGFAQPYKSCLDGEIVKWSILYEVLCYGKQSDNWIAYGDTVLHNKTYKSLFSYRFEDYNGNWKDYIPADLSAERWFIRENEDASQLYVFNTYFNQEYLIMNLNLEVGDVFQQPEIWRFRYPPFNNEFIVDSVYMHDGLKYVRFNYEIWPGNWSKLTFTEGTGPNVVFPVDDLILGQILNCFQNQSVFYKNDVIRKGDGTECPCGYNVPWTAINAPVSNKDYVIQRNNNIEIDFSTNADRQLSMYDISGRLCYTVNLVSGKNIIIPTVSFPKGIYLLKIFNKNRNAMDVEKIIL